MKLQQCVFSLISINDYIRSRSTHRKDKWPIKISLIWAFLSCFSLGLVSLWFFRSMVGQTKDRTVSPISWTNGDEYLIKILVWFPNECSGTSRRRFFGASEPAVDCIISQVLRIDSLSTKPINKAWSENALKITTINPNSRKILFVSSKLPI